MSTPTPMVSEGSRTLQEVALIDLTPLSKQQVPEHEGHPSVEASLSNNFV